jgi:hypothetical protein
MHNGSSVGIDSDGFQPQIKAIAVINALHTFFFEHKKLSNQSKRSGDSLVSQDLNSLGTNARDLRKSTYGEKTYEIMKEQKYTKG